MLPALRNRVFQDDPHQGFCTACNTLATTQHVAWECPEHASARFNALADIPVADRPSTFEDRVIPQDMPPPTFRLLWNQLCSFFYADGGPAGLLSRWPWEPRDEKDGWKGLLEPRENVMNFLLILVFLTLTGDPNFAMLASKTSIPGQVMWREVRLHRTWLPRSLAQSHRHIKPEVGKQEP
ncbi:hypothetical protein HPB47_014720 [Ixodes persulcatus]|uniref:Uncharacterized protein n=1 Tax=Ixodes persulcatus TaxID=34615 RepID=A0AC60QVI6_IXOPE|nr:hypothetical protein HPB47_014720 [Ixodes persulcatus]